MRLNGNWFVEVFCAILLLYLYFDYDVSVPTFSLLRYVVYVDLFKCLNSMMSTATNINMKKKLKF